MKRNRLRALRFTPGTKIHGIQGNAEDVRGDKTKLSRAESDHAHHGAIHRSENPTLPATLSQQKSRNHRKNAGQIVKPEPHRSTSMI
jgi:hypothetical protein